MSSIHPEIEALPEWQLRTIAVLATLGDGPHAIPVSAPLRAGDRHILLSLHRDRGSLARLREDPRVALLVLAEDATAFTAHGRAQVVAEPLAGAPDYVGVAIEVEAVHDHRQEAFRVESGVGRTWIDEGEQRALGDCVQALRQLAEGDSSE